MLSRMMSQLNKGKSVDTLLVENKAMTPERSRQLRETNRERTFKLLNRNKRIDKKSLKSRTKSKGYLVSPDHFNRIYSLYESDDKFCNFYNNWLNDDVNGNYELLESLDFAHKKSYIDSMILFIYGPKRTGKSFWARHIVRADARIMHCNIHWHMYSTDEDSSIDETLDAEWTKFIDCYEIFGFEYAPKIVPLMKEHDWLIVDEYPDMQQEGSVNLMKAINNLFKISSGKCLLNFIVINQQFKAVKNVQIYLGLIATNRDKFKTLGTKSTMNDENKLVFDVILDWDVSGEPDEVHELFENKNKELKEKELNDGGINKMRLDLDDVTRVVNAVHAMTQEQKDAIGENEFTKEGELLAFIDICPELDDLSGNHKIKSIANLALKKLKEDKPSKKDRKSNNDNDESDENNDERKQKLVDSIISTLDNHILTPLDDIIAKNSDSETLCSEQEITRADISGICAAPGEYFVFDVESALDRMLKNKNKDWSLKILAWRRYKEGRGYVDISKEFTKEKIFEKLHQKGSDVLIRKWIKSVDGELVRIRGEDAYEDHYEEFLRSLPNYKNIRRGKDVENKKSGHNVWDFERERFDGVIEVVNCKCYTEEIELDVRIPPSKFKAEIDHVKNLRKKGKKAILIGHSFNTFNQFADEQYIDVNDLPSIIKFRMK